MPADPKEVVEIALAVARRGDDLEPAIARLIRAVGFRRAPIESGLELCCQERIRHPDQRTVYDRAVDVLTAALKTGLFR